jgi:uncharacterized protein YutE (UPF0331/DUF86 family)
MSPETAVLAEKAAAVERHLRRVVDLLLAERLTRAAGFRNLVAHAYEDLDMARVYRSATQGPADLRAFLAAMASLRTKIARDQGF